MIAGRVGRVPGASLRGVVANAYLLTLAAAVFPNFGAPEPDGNGLEVKVAGAKPITLARKRLEALSIGYPDLTARVLQTSGIS